MRVAAIQHDIAWCDRQANFAHLAPMIASAAAAGARLNHHAAAGQHVRYRPRLNRRERLPSRLCGRRAQPFGQLFECDVG